MEQETTIQVVLQVPGRQNTLSNSLEKGNIQLSENLCVIPGIESLWYARIEVLKWYILYAGMVQDHEVINSYLGEVR